MYIFSPWGKRSVEVFQVFICRNVSAYKTSTQTADYKGRLQADITFLT